MEFAADSLYPWKMVFAADVFFLRKWFSPPISFLNPREMVFAAEFCLNPRVMVFAAEVVVFI